MDFTYHVVEFLPEKGVAIVPSLWLHKDSVSTELKSHWPPYNSSDRITKATRTGAIPDHRWSSYPCRDLGESGDYLRARQKLEECQYTSHIDTEPEEEGIQHPQRKRRQPEALFSSDEEEGDDARPAKSRRQLAPPPCITSPVMNSDIENRWQNSQLDVTVQSCPVVATPARMSPHPTPRPVTTPSRTPIGTTGSTFPATGYTAFERYLIGQLAEMKSFFIALQQGQRELAVKIDNLKGGEQQGSTNTQLPDDICFPLRNMREVETLEHRLNDPQLQKCISINLSVIGGSTIKECTRRVLRHIITDKCARLFNWKGKGGKRAFSALTLKTVVNRSVRKNGLTAKATDDEVEKEVKEWLKFAAERDGGRKERDELRRNNRQIC